MVNNLTLIFKNVNKYIYCLLTNMFYVNSVAPKRPVCFVDTSKHYE